MNEQTQALAIQSQPNILAIIERATKDPGVDVAKMEQLLALAERIHDREAKIAYDSSMTAAQGEMRSISKDCHNPQTRSRYASSQAIDEAIRPIYTSHGFSMSFGAKASPVPDHVIVTCRVSHRAGHTELVELDMAADGKGAKGGDVMTRTHATGSAISYAKRYITGMVWNLSFGESDDDGNAAGQRQQTRQQPKQYTVKPSEPMKATEKTREWMLKTLSQFTPEQLCQFMHDHGFPTANPQEWPLEQVPTNRAMLDSLVRQIEEFIASQAQAKPDHDERTEWFWDVKIPLPRAGMKAKDYVGKEDTIRSLYDEMKATGDEKVRTRFWGIMNNYNPETPTELELRCREACDAFLEHHEAKG